MNKEFENKIINSIMEELSEEFHENLISGKLYESAILVMINYEKNEALLKDMVHKRFMEFAIVPKWKSMSLNVGGTCYVSISNALAERFDIDVDELFQEAYNNTLKKQGFEVFAVNPLYSDSAEEFIEDLLRSPFVPEEQLQEGSEYWDYLYLITNRRLEYGAVSLYIKEILHKAYKKYGRSFYIIPSSVHELLIFFDVPYIGLDGVKHLLNHVNTEMLNFNEALSDNIYFYDGEKGEVSLI